MVQNENLQVISEDIERVKCLHSVSPFELMVKSEEKSLNGLWDDDYKYEALHFAYHRSLDMGADRLLEFGKSYYKGTDTISQKYDTALTYFAMAGSLGNTDGMFFAGYLFFSGKGTDVNYIEAFYWFAFAAEQNDSRGFFCLGDFYLNGHGVVEKNLDIAKYLLNISAEMGLPEAKEALNKLNI